MKAMELEKQWHADGGCGKSVAATGGSDELYVIEIEIYHWVVCRLNDQNQWTTRFFTENSTVSDSLQIKCNSTKSQTKCL